MLSVSLNIFDVIKSLVFILTFLYSFFFSRYIFVPIRFIEPIIEFMWIMTNSLNKLSDVALDYDGFPKLNIRTITADQHERSLLKYNNFFAIPGLNCKLS
uniref:Uncharacterized protein n=1 Tax=Sipha flava TaxID=143950 RepID=A0A2S2QI60_9HEMI